MNVRPLNRLKVVLVEKQRTSKWLAEQLGVSTVTVSKWCTNMHQPDLQTLAKIADLLGCEKRELITEYICLKVKYINDAGNYLQ